MVVLGVVVVVISLLLLFVPLVGGYLTVLPGLLALLVGRSGAKWALIGVGINGIHVLFLSDFIRFNAMSGIRDRVYLPVLIYIGLALLQVVAGLVLGFRQVAGSEGVGGTGASSRGAR
ncbi:MAG: hypothetical protein HQM00_04745 [Magnetococcales bacterium]|nr:hypothetical protein [Magnetococcales bacterium]